MGLRARSQTGKIDARRRSLKPARRFSPTFQHPPTILLMAVFAGFPAALNGMAAAAQVFAEKSGHGRP